MTTQMRTEPEGLADLQRFGLELTRNLDSVSSTLVHEWDAGASRRTERWVRESPREAHAKGRTVAPEYPPTTVTVDLDAPDSPVEGAPPRWAAAERAARVLGLTVVAAPSGSEAHGVRSMTGVVVSPSLEHAQGYVLLLETFAGVRGLARAGGRNRTLGGWRDKPHHSRVYDLGGVLVPGGAWERRTTDELREIVARPSYVPSGQVDALLRVNGAGRAVAGPVPIPEGDGTIDEMRDALTRFRTRDGRPLLEVADSNGEGYDTQDPTSRHQGEGAVITALVRRGYGAQAIQAFLDTHEIGGRMRHERLAGGRVVHRSPAAQAKHVRRAVRNAAALVAATGGARRSAQIDADTGCVLSQAWAAPCTHEARVTFAVLALVAERAGRTQVELAQLDLELLTGMDGWDALQALRSHPCVDEVMPGDRDGTPTMWQIRAPRVTPAPSPVHAPGWDAVAEAAGSAVVAGGGVGRTHRAHTALVLATIRDLALKPREIATAIDSTPERVGRVLQRLAAAELTERRAGARHRLVVPLWLGAMATGTADHTERKASVVAARRERRQEQLQGLRDATAHRGVVLAGDPGPAAVVVAELPVIDAGDPRAALAAAYVGDPGMDGGGPVHPGLLALVDHTLAATGGDADLGIAWMVTAGEMVRTWAEAGADGVVPTSKAISVALQAVARLAEGYALDDADRASVTAAGASGTARIDWPAPAVAVPAVTLRAPSVRVIHAWSDDDEIGRAHV